MRSNLAVSAALSLSVWEPSTRIITAAHHYAEADPRAELSVSPPKKSRKASAQAKKKRKAQRKARRINR